MSPEQKARKREYNREWRRRNRGRPKTEEQKARHNEVARRHYLKNRDKALTAKRLWKRNNPEKARIACERWRDNNKEKIIEYHVNRYGITVADRDRMMRAQGTQCPGCKVSFWDINPRCVHIDHCHLTGRVRGILCVTCNRALGLLRDNPEIFRCLAEYLEHSKVSHESAAA